MKIEGAIFDVDGTLLDSMHIWDRAGDEYLLSLGIQPKPDLRQVIKVMSLTQVAEYFHKEYNVEKTVEEIMDGINQVVAEFYLNKAETKLGVRETLEHFQGKGVKMCVATATDMNLIDAALTRCGIRKYFQEIFTCESVGAGKDKPVIYEKALESLGTSKESTWVFEDALYAAKTAKAAGFNVVGVFDKAEVDEEELRAISDKYITEFDLDVLNFVAEAKA